MSSSSSSSSSIESDECQTIARALGPWLPLPTDCCGVGVDTVGFPSLAIGCNAAQQVVSIKLDRIVNRTSRATFPFPVIFSTFPELTSLDINGGFLENTTLPSDAFSTGWPKLERLSLSSSSVAGPLPASLTALRSLRRLDVGNNPDLSGRLPNDPAAVWPALETLVMLRTKVSATLNDNWSKLTELTDFRIGDDITQGRYINGTLEPLARLSKLTALEVWRGNFNTTLPEALVSNNPNLTTLNLVACGFNGAIPASYNLRSSALCNLSGNFLAGTIPQAIYSSGCYIQKNCFTADDVAPRLWTNPDLGPLNVDQKSPTECQAGFLLTPSTTTTTTTPTPGFTLTLPTTLPPIRNRTLNLPTPIPASTGIAGGTIVAIAIGATVVVMVIVVIAWGLHRRRQLWKRMQERAVRHEAELKAYNEAFAPTVVYNTAPNAPAPAPAAAWNHPTSAAAASSAWGPGRRQAVGVVGGGGESK
ncbi:hypothetical protein HDU96_000451 [Phlyctochytrium bullatum]|nr:hypothetical protein HDU96_000451 [Phlyctochytrium bullatum]